MLPFFVCLFFNLKKTYADGAYKSFFMLTLMNKFTGKYFQSMF